MPSQWGNQLKLPSPNTPLFYNFYPHWCSASSFIYIKVQNHSSLRRWRSEMQSTQRCSLTLQRSYDALDYSFSMSIIILHSLKRYPSIYMYIHWCICGMYMLCPVLHPPQSPYFNWHHKRIDGIDNFQLVTFLAESTRAGSPEEIMKIPAVSCSRQYDHVLRFDQLKSKPASALIAYISFTASCSLLYHQHNFAHKSERT